MGMLDALNFVREFKFVDATRIGMVGHSMGAMRSNAAAVLDCGFLSLNDQFINALCDEFGEEFTLEEIAKDADSLAKERLNADQLAHYDTLKAEITEHYNTRLKACIPLGIGASTAVAPSTVTVAGHEVLRNIQCNMNWQSGEFDGCWNFGVNQDHKNYFYTPDADIKMGTWYSLDNIKESSKQLGEFYSESVVSNKELASAIENRTARVFVVTPDETHSKEFFSSKTNTAIVKFFEQTLGYNGGNLGDSSAKPIDATSNVWVPRAICNVLALFSMVGMLGAIASLLMKSEAFTACAAAPAEAAAPAKFNKKRYWLIGLVTAVFGFISIYIANKHGLMLINPNNFMPLTRPASLTLVFVALLAVGTIIIMAYNIMTSKKENGNNRLASLNAGLKVGVVMKYIGLAFILLVAGYVSVSCINYFFGQDYRFWMTVLTEVKSDNWIIVLPYAVILFPLYLIIGAGINYQVRTDIPVWKDTAITVFVNSVGVWLCCLVNIVIAWTTPYNGTFFSSFICSYQVVLLVPITSYITRKMYNITRSIWTGAALNTFIICWSLSSAIGYNDIYFGQNWFNIFLNV